MAPDNSFRINMALINPCTKWIKEKVTVYVFSWKSDKPRVPVIKSKESWACLQNNYGVNIDTCRHWKKIDKMPSSRHHTDKIIFSTD